MWVWRWQEERREKEREFLREALRHRPLHPLSAPLVTCGGAIWGWGWPGQLTVLRSFVVRGGVGVAGVCEDTARGDDDRPALFLLRHDHPVLRAFDVLDSLRENRKKLSVDLLSIQIIHFIIQNNWFYIWSVVNISSRYFHVLIYDFRCSSLVSTPKLVKCEDELKGIVHTQEEDYHMIYSSKVYMTFFFQTNTIGVILKYVNGCIKCVHPS